MAWFARLMVGMQFSSPVAMRAMPLPGGQYPGPEAGDQDDLWWGETTCDGKKKISRRSGSKPISASLADLKSRLRLLETLPLCNWWVRSYGKRRRCGKPSE